MPVDIGLFRTEALIEEVAIELMRMQGYICTGEQPISQAQNPRIQQSYAMSRKAVEMVLDAIAEIEAEQEEPPNVEHCEIYSCGSKD